MSVGVGQKVAEPSDIELFAGLQRCSKAILCSKLSEENHSGLRRAAALSYMLTGAKGIERSNGLCSLDLPSSRPE